MTAEKQNQGSNPLGWEKIPALLRQFAVPSIIAMVVSSLYNIVDQIFIGQGVGYLGNAATNVAFPITTICLALTLLIGIGGAANFSLELGRGNDAQAEKTVGTVVWMAAIVGVTLAAVVESAMTPMLYAFGATKTVLPYAQSYVRFTGLGLPFLLLTNVMSNMIRADGSPKYSMMFMVVGAVTNTILDPIFIFGLHLGVAGAAMATALSQVLSCIIAVRYLFQYKTVQLTRASFARPNLWDCGHIAMLGMSNSLNQVLFALVQVILNHSLTHYGALSIYGTDIPLSGAGICMKVNAIVIGVFVGLAQGSQPILGFNYGARQYGRVKATFKLAVKYSFIISVIAFVAFQFFPKTIVSLFGAADNRLYMRFTVLFMRTFLCTVLINGVQLLSSNFFSAIGKPARGIVLSLSRQVLFLIPMILILPLKWGIVGIMWSAPMADLASFVLSLVLDRIEFRKMDQLSAAAVS
ncbi:MATE family efflux transporter [Pseudoramibacter alactolyticus]|uniref:MATE family efflux transporter n=1 Tax=Pseudoramibacter alactolyticus TaxID=113287 RepID=UPI0023522722|nr:MATE family efflux transporter [Pseudoramibacter alactolyticus]MBM6968905.1 MATE family efflux transporter [Pseudoramibacter alactolyticus]